MTQEQILKEQNNLILVQMEALVTYNYYMDQHIRIMEELVSQQEASLSMEEIQNLSPEEREKKLFELKKNLARLEAGQEILKLIDRLKEKALRKNNEAKQRLDAFCKRYNLKNPQKD